MSRTRIALSLPAEVATNRNSFRWLIAKAWTAFMASKIDVPAQIQLYSYHSTMGRRSFESVASEQNAVLIPSVYMYNIWRVLFQGTALLHWSAQPSLSVVQPFNRLPERLLMTSSIEFGPWGDFVWTARPNMIRASKIFQLDWHIERQMRYWCTEKARLFVIMVNGLVILVPM